MQRLRGFSLGCALACQLALPVAAAEFPAEWAGKTVSVVADVSTRIVVSRDLEPVDYSLAVTSQIYFSKTGDVLIYDGYARGARLAPGESRGELTFTAGDGSVYTSKHQLSATRKGFKTSDVGSVGHVVDTTTYEVEILGGVSGRIKSYKHAMHNSAYPLSKALSAKPTSCTIKDGPP